MKKTTIAAGLAIAALGNSIALSVQAAPIETGQQIVSASLKYVGAPYRSNVPLSEQTPQTGFNDLGFVRYVFQRDGITLPATLRGLVHDGQRVPRAALQPGDLIFFKNTVKAGLSHVGIYAGNGQFVHAEWYGYGVTVSSLQYDPRDGNYWITHYQAAIRPAQIQ